MPWAQTTERCDALLPYREEHMKNIPLSHSSYDCADIEFFQRIVETAFTQLRDRQDGVEDPALIERLTVHLLKIAEDGERDYGALINHTLAAVRSELRRLEPDPTD